MARITRSSTAAKRSNPKNLVGKRSRSTRSSRSTVVMRPKSKASSSSQAAIKLDSEGAKDTKLTEKGEMTTERPAESERRRLLEWFDLEYTDRLANSGWKAA